MHQLRPLTLHNLQHPPPLATALQIAKSMLVCGLFTKLKFPFAQFPSLNLSYQRFTLHPFLGIKQLEFSGSKVVAAIIPHCNPFARGRSIFFSSPILHTCSKRQEIALLINSRRKMWVSMHVYNIIYHTYMHACSVKGRIAIIIVDHYYNNCGTELSRSSMSIIIISQFFLKK